MPWDPPDPLVPQGRPVSRAHMDPWDLEEPLAFWVLLGRLATSDPKVGGCIHTMVGKDTPGADPVSCCRTCPHLSPGAGQPPPCPWRVCVSFCSSSESFPPFFSPRRKARREG